MQQDIGINDYYLTGKVSERKAKYCQMLADREHYENEMP